MKGQPEVMRGISGRAQAEAGPGSGRPAGQGRDGDRSRPADDATLTRRRILRRSVGLAAAGIAGGAVLAEMVAAPAEAATTTEPAGYTPAVVTLSDDSTIAVNASLGNDFRITLGGNRTVGNPTNAADGQDIIFQVTQGPGGPFTLAWGTSYAFSSNLPPPVLSQSAGHTDLIGFLYDGIKQVWRLVAVVTGFP